MHIIFMTPKAAARLTDEVKARMAKLGPYRLEITSHVYMNMLGGWTEEECDDVAYIVEERHLTKLEKISIEATGFRFASQTQ